MSQPYCRIYSDASPVPTEERFCAYVLSKATRLMTSGRVSNGALVRRMLDALRNVTVRLGRSGGTIDYLPGQYAHATIDRQMGGIRCLLYAVHELMHAVYGQYVHDAAPKIDCNAWLGHSGREVLCDCMAYLVVDEFRREWREFRADPGNDGCALALVCEDRMCNPRGVEAAWDAILGELSGGSGGTVSQRGSCTTYTISSSSITEHYASVRRDQTQHDRLVDLLEKFGMIDNVRALRLI